MIDRDAEPIGHEPIYKSIYLGGPRNVASEPTHAFKTLVDMIAEDARQALERLHKAEYERIWDLVRGASEGNG